MKSKDMENFQSSTKLRATFILTLVMFTALTGFASYHYVKTQSIIDLYAAFVFGTFLILPALLGPISYTKLSYDGSEFAIKTFLTDWAPISFEQIKRVSYNDQGLVIEYFDNRNKTRMITDDFRFRKAAEQLIQKIKQVSFSKAMEHMDEHGVPLYPSIKHISGVVGLFAFTIVLTLHVWLKPFGESSRYRAKEAIFQLVGPIAIILLGIILLKMISASANRIAINKSGFLFESDGRIIPWHEIEKIKIVEGWVFTSLRISTNIEQSLKIDFSWFKNDIFLKQYLFLRHHRKGRRAILE